MCIYILIFPFLFYSKVSKPYALFYTVLLHSTIYLGDRSSWVRRPSIEGRPSGTGCQSQTRVRKVTVQGMVQLGALEPKQAQALEPKAEQQPSARWGGVHTGGRGNHRRLFMHRGLMKYNSHTKDNGSYICYW